MAITLQVRAELVRRARDKNRRQSLFSRHAPCEWRPYQVLRPESGLPFDDSGAWNFIADLLQSGHDVQAVTMRKPPGQTGYVMLADGYSGCPKIYIKLTLSANMVNGRSFHDDECGK